MLSVVQCGDALVVTSRGDLDYVNEAFLRSTLRIAGESASGPIVVSLATCTFIDSAALGALSEAGRILGPRMRIALPSDSPIMRTFKTTNFREIVDIFPSVEDALASRAA